MIILQPHLSYRQSVINLHPGPMVGLAMDWVYSTLDISPHIKKLDYVSMEVCIVTIVDTACFILIYRPNLVNGLDQISINQCLDNLVDDYFSVNTNVFDVHALLGPKITVRREAKSLPWISSEIISLIRLRRIKERSWSRLRTK